VKTGLFASAEQLRWIADRLSPLRKQFPVVVDPVLATTAAGWSADTDLVNAYLECLLPLATVATPNLPELERLLPGGDGTGLLGVGCSSVLVKGGHGEGDVIKDVLYTARGRREFAHPRAEVGPVHGTGCALASALAAYLGSGTALEAACESAIDDLQRCLRATPSSADDLPQPLVIS
jgi:hydroxymethylpyrimidine/phosphomethylpyrimidine kinase